MNAAYSNQNKQKRTNDKIVIKIYKANINMTVKRNTVANAY